MGSLVPCVHQNCRRTRNILVHFSSTLYAKYQKGFQNVFRIPAKTVMFRNLAQSLFLLKSVVAYVETVFPVAFAIIKF
jgi:hypothetical protein